MKIGVFGTGKMGGGLGRRWADAGHKVFFGSRHPAQAQQLAESIGKNALAGTISEAADFGEVMLVAVPWYAVYEVLLAAGPMGGKTIIDCTNPYLPGEVDPGTAADGNSGAEQIQHWLPGANVVKAFNGIHYQHLANPRFDGQPETLFLCGDDIGAKGIVVRLGWELGFEPVDVGPLSAAHALEALGYLWTQLAYNAGQGSNIAFKLIKRK
jgi:predicted dinucleotide-binding enzyme